MFTILERVAAERLDLVSIFIEPACHIVFSHRRLTGKLIPSQPYIPKTSLGQESYSSTSPQFSAIDFPKG